MKNKLGCIVSLPCRGFACQTGGCRPNSDRGRIIMDASKALRSTLVPLLLAVVFLTFIHYTPAQAQSYRLIDWWGSDLSGASVDSSGNLYIADAGNNPIQLFTPDKAAKTGSDFDGDGKEEIAVWRLRDGNWYFIRSSDGTVVPYPGGTAGDIQIPGDHELDGRTDIAVWRLSDGNWYFICSSDGSVVLPQWGAGRENDCPISSGRVR